MTTTLTYGKAATCLLDSAEVVALRSNAQVTSLAAAKIVDAIRAQLETPLNFPPLSQATIPGDVVAVAVGLGVPQLTVVLDGVLSALRHAGAEASLTTVLFADATTDLESLRADLAALGHGECQLKTHNPDDEKQRAMLGVTQAGQALRLNRELCDADFVLPVTVTVCDHKNSKNPASFAGLFPEFSDRETIERFSTDDAEQNAISNSEISGEETEEQQGDAFASHDEAEECGRQLGVGIALQVVPAPAGQVAAITAGEPLSVARQSQVHYRQTWECEVKQRGALVIATLTGDANQQTWQNVGRALVAAQTLLQEGGAIAICSELAELPGRAIGYLAGNEDLLVVEREILRSPSADSIAALQLCRALQQGPIYLRSKLRAQVVESLGITPLESDSEIEHLAQTLRPCFVLEEAQRLLPTVIETEM